jgi:hypothetical protein
MSDVPHVFIGEHVAEQHFAGPSGVLEPETECLVLLWTELSLYTVHPLHNRNLVCFEQTLALHST